MNRNSSTALLLVAAIVLLSASSVYAGELEPSAPPAPTMYSLSEVHSAIQSGSVSDLQFLGTTAATSPAIGVLSLTAQCQQTFGAGTRMCTTEEIVNTFNLPEPSDWNSPSGWVRPVFDFSSGTATYDAPTGFQGSTYQLNCARWSTTEYNGLVVHLLGAYSGIDRNLCTDATTGVACCGPVSP